MHRRSFIGLVGMGVTSGALTNSPLSSQALAREQRSSSKQAPGSRKALMKVGTQNASSDEALRMFAALGVNNICSTLPSPRFDEPWSKEGLMRLKERVESFQIKLDMVPLPLSSA